MRALGAGPMYSSKRNEGWMIEKLKGGFPGGSVIKNLPANAGDTGLSPDLGRLHMPWRN